MNHSSGLQQPLQPTQLSLGYLKRIASNIVTREPSCPHGFSGPSVPTQVASRKRPASSLHPASDDEEDDKDESTDRWKMFKSLTKKKQSDDAVEDEGKESDDDGKHDEPDSIAEEDGEDGEEEEEEDDA